MCVQPVTVWIQIILKKKGPRFSYHPSRAVSRHLLQSSRATAADVTFLLPGIRYVRGRPAVTFVISVHFMFHGNGATVVGTN